QDRFKAARHGGRRRDAQGLTHRRCCKGTGAGRGQMSREENWNGYIESMALLARAELRTAAARLALEEAEAQEATLRHAVHRARDELDAVAAREAGGLWISLDEWSAKRESPPDAA